MSDVSSVLEMIKENDIRFVDLRFTDHEENGNT